MKAPSGDVDEPIAERPWHRAVELRDDNRRRLDRSQRGIHRRAKGAEAVLVRSRDVDEDGVQRHDPAPEEVRNIGQEGRDVLCAPLVDRLARVRPDEERHVAEMAFHLWRQGRTGSLAREVHDPHLLQLAGTGHQRVRQHGWGCAGAVQVHRLARPDACLGLSRMNDSHRGRTGRTGRVWVSE